ncbi:MAG: hypothetical protein HY706_16070 [Candidatus Hydrogenedentes bacterium]|nr:hypothetical protein [Candidatus Hydrogenedentota bacterium]
MIQTLEAVIDQAGNLRLLQPVALPSMRRALVTILDDEPEPSVLETVMMSEPALALDWNNPEEDAAWSHLDRLPSL